MRIVVEFARGTDYLVTAFPLCVGLAAPHLPGSPTHAVPLALQLGDDHALGEDHALVEL
jgi:hypothetical protein